MERQKVKAAPEPTIHHHQPKMLCLHRPKETAAHTKGKEQKKVQEDISYLHRKINQKTMYVSAAR